MERISDPKLDYRYSTRLKTKSVSEARSSSVTSQKKSYVLVFAGADKLRDFPKEVAKKAEKNSLAG